MVKNSGECSYRESENSVDIKIPIPEEIIDKYSSFFGGSRDLNNFNFLFDLDLHEPTSTVWKQLSVENKMEDSAIKSEKPVGMKTIDHYFRKKCANQEIDKKSKKYSASPDKSVSKINTSVDSRTESVKSKNSHSKCSSPIKRVCSDLEVNESASQDLFDKNLGDRSLKSSVDVEFEDDLIPCTQGEEQLKSKFDSSNYLSSGSVINNENSSSSDDSDANPKLIEKKKAKSNRMESCTDTNKSNILETVWEKKRKRNSSSSSSPLSSKKSKVNHSELSNPIDQSCKANGMNAQASNDDDDDGSSDATSNYQRNNIANSSLNNDKSSVTSTGKPSSSDESRIHKTSHKSPLAKSNILHLNPSNRGDNDSSTNSDSSDSELTNKSNSNDKRNRHTKQITPSSPKSLRNKNEAISKTGKPSRLDDSGSDSSSLSDSDDTNSPLHNDSSGNKTISASSRQKFQGSLNAKNVSGDDEGALAKAKNNTMNLSDTESYSETMLTYTKSNVEESDDSTSSSHSDSNPRAAPYKSYDNSSSSTSSSQSSDEVNSRPQPTKNLPAPMNKGKKVDTDSSDSEQESDIGNMLTSNINPILLKKPLLNKNNSSEDTSDSDEKTNDRDTSVTKTTIETSNDKVSLFSPRKKGHENNSASRETVKEKRKVRESSSEEEGNEFSFKSSDAMKMLGSNEKSNNRNSLSCTSSVSSKPQAKKAAGAFQDKLDCSTEDSESDSSSSEDDRDHGKGVIGKSKDPEALGTDKSVIFHPAASSSFVSTPDFMLKKDNLLKMSKMESVKRFHLIKESQHKSNRLESEPMTSNPNKQPEEDKQSKKSSCDKEGKSSSSSSDSSEDGSGRDKKKRHGKTEGGPPQVGNGSSELKPTCNPAQLLLQAKNFQHCNMVRVSASEKLSVPGCICLEDISSDDEIYTLQCPKQVNAESLLGAKISLTGESVLEGRTDAGQTVSLETFAQRIPSRINLLLPSKKSSTFKVGGYQVCGSIIISERYNVPEIDANVFSSTCAEDSSDEHDAEATVSTPLPPGLKIRHPLHGINFKDAPTPNFDAVISREKKNAKKRKKDKGRGEEKELGDSMMKMIDSLMMNKKHSLQGDEFKKPSTDTVSLTKKQKRKVGVVIGRNAISLVSDDESSSTKSNKKAKKKQNNDQDLLEKLVEEETRMQEVGCPSVPASSSKKKKKKKGEEEAEHDDLQSKEDYDAAKKKKKKRKE